MQSFGLGTRLQVFLQDCSNHSNCKTLLELQPPHKISLFLHCELYTHLCKQECVTLFWDFFFFLRVRLQGASKHELHGHTELETQLQRLKAL